VSYTASIRLDRAWLTDAMWPTDSPIVSGTTRPQDWSVVREGSVRVYAGGRRQMVTGPAHSRTTPVTFVGLSYAQMLQMTTTWVGRTLLFRSRLGERFYCTYFTAAVHNIDHTTLNDGRAFNVSVELFEVDFDESV
jgi:hypothetical protein